MAIQISGTTVIDNSRNVKNVIGVGETATTIYYGDGSKLLNVGITTTVTEVTSGVSSVIITIPQCKILIFVTVELTLVPSSATTFELSSNGGSSYSTPIEFSPDGNPNDGAVIVTNCDDPNTDKVSFGIKENFANDTLLETIAISGVINRLRISGGTFYSGKIVTYALN